MKTKGADGECVDCFIGDHPECTQVFVVDQIDQKTGAFDEHKALLFFRNEQEARAGYLSAYSKGWKCGPIKALTMPAFKKWLEEGHTGEPIGGQAIALSAHDVSEEGRDPAGKWTHGAKATSLAAKHAELKAALEAHHKERHAAFGEIKGRADEAAKKAGELAGTLRGNVDNIAWLADKDGDYHADLEQAIHDYDDAETPGEKFEQLKNIEAEAKSFMAAKPTMESSPGSDDGLSDKDVAENAKRAAAIVTNARAAREHLRTYVKHRKEMKAIKEGQPISLSAADPLPMPDGSAEWTEPITLSTAHAPAGYGEKNLYYIGGKGFKGGQFVPPEVVARGSEEEKAGLVTKESHELTRDEFAATKSVSERAATIKRWHEKAVREAHKKGLAVPEHVLAEYPKLQPRGASPAAETVAEPPHEVAEKAEPWWMSDKAFAAEKAINLVPGGSLNEASYRDAQLNAAKAHDQAADAHEKYGDAREARLHRASSAKWTNAANGNADGAGGEKIPPRTEVEAVDSESDAVAEPAAVATEEKPLAIGDAVHYDAGDGKIIETGIRHIKTSQSGKQTYTLYTGQKGVEAHDLTRIDEEPDEDEEAAPDPFAEIKGAIRTHFAEGGKPSDELLDALDKFPRKLRNEFVAAEGLSPGLTDENADVAKLFAKYGPEADDLDPAGTDLESSDDMALSKEEQEQLDNMTPDDVAEVRRLLEPDHGTQGKVTDIETPNGTSIPARYEVRELGTVIASNEVLPGGAFRNRAKAGEYPPSLQPRDYESNPAEQAKVLRFASNMQPLYWLTWHPDATSGPPIIAADGTVINGNGRHMALEMARNVGTYAKYKAALLQHAAEFGIDPKTIEGMREPALYRVVDMDPAGKEASRFAAVGNVATTQSQGTGEPAASMSRFIPENISEQLNLGPDTTFSEAVTRPGGKAFRERLLAEIRHEAPTMEADLFENTGSLTPKGVEFVRSMLLSKLLPHTLVSRLGAERAQLLNGIENAIPQLLLFQRSGDATNIAPQVREALDVYSRNPSMKTAADADLVASQGDLFESGVHEPISPAGRMMLDFLVENRDSPAKLRRGLVELAGASDLKMGGLFSEQMPDMVSLAAETLGVKPRDGAQFGYEAGELHDAHAEAIRSGHTAAEVEGGVLRGEEAADSEAEAAQGAEGAARAPADTVTTEPHANPHVALSDALAARLRNGETITAKELFAAADLAHGGTRAQGKYGPSDAYDSLEAGFNKALAGKTDPSADLGDAVAQAEELADKVGKLPTQTNRSGNKDSMQQFSTPPHYAFAATWLANLSAGDTVLEPTAGTGSLAIHAQNAGANVIANELDANRLAHLRDQFGEANVHNENAEQIGAILPARGVHPSVVVMNPPFSQTAGRLGDKKDLLTGAKHITEALQTLEPGGRCVAIVGRGMTPESPTYAEWFRKLKEKGCTLRANVGVGGDEYKKYGTHFSTRTLIIDKDGGDGAEAVTGDAADIPDLMRKLEGVRNDRATGISGAGNASDERAGGSSAALPGGAAEPGAARPGGLPADVDGGAAAARSGQLPTRNDRVPSAEPQPVPEGELSGHGPGGTGPGVGQPTGPSGVADPSEPPDGATILSAKRGKPGSAGKNAGRKSPRGFTVPAPELRPATSVSIEPVGAGAAASKKALTDTAPGEPATEQSSASLFDAWSPQTMHIPGSVPHVSPLVESAAMSAVRLPKLSVDLKLSPDLVQYKEVEDTMPDGRKVKRNVGLTQAGLEQVAYMAQANEQHLQAPDVKEGEQQKPAPRRWMFSGDGTGCIAAGTRIYNPVAGEHVPVEVLVDRNRPHIVLALTPNGLVPHLAETPFIKGVSELYRVTLESGREVTVTARHRFLTPSGWRRIDEGLRAGCFLGCAQDPLACSSGVSPLIRAANDPRSLQRPEDCLDHCWPGHAGPHDELPPQAQGSVQALSLSQGDAPGRSRPSSRADDLGTSPERSRRRRQRARLSRSNFFQASSLAHALTQARVVASSSRPLVASCQAAAQSPLLKAVCRSTAAAPLHQSACLAAGSLPQWSGEQSPAVAGIFSHETPSSCIAAPQRRLAFRSNTPERSGLASVGVEGKFSSGIYTGWDRIRTIDFLGKGTFYDFHVPGPENYVAEGMIHHNSGKGRQVTGLIAHNLNEGRNKHVWVSLRSSLIKDARRDASDMGIDPNKVIPFEDLKGKAPPADGIVFITYATLASGSTDKTKPQNLEILSNWMGKDFDGVIAFDEAHAMMNAQQMEGEMGKSDTSQRAVAGMKLQDAFPEARGGYWSATGATEVENLAYADRLGLWGPGTAFPRKMDFINQMKQGGVGAMEAVAQSAKATGAYNARTLSMNDGTPEGTVVVKPLEHVLKDHQRQTYDSVAEGWQNVLGEIDKVLESTNAGKNKNAKGAANSQFWGAQQRFFNQMLTGMQTESVIAAAKQDIADGRAPVIQLVNTMEASTNRALAKRTEEQTLDDVDISPREILQNYLERSFPIHRYELYKDANGNEHSRPVRSAMKAGDKGTTIKGVAFAPGQTIPSAMAEFANHAEVTGGDMVVDPEALKKRDELIANANDLHIPESPLDQLTHAFGNRLAEVTGRKQRFVWVKDKHGNDAKQLERRSDKDNAVAVEGFQNSDDKDLLVFSGAGNTGASYHADKRAKNQKQRVHYVLQPGWSAAPLVQSLGRSHRTNQSSAPIIRPVAIPEVPGNKRFLSSAARRLEQMGALTRGQKQAASGGLYAAADNLESEESQEAVDRFFNDMKNGRMPGLEYQATMKQLGFKTEETDKQGNTRAKAKPKVGVRQFLNRLLALKLDTQNKVFDEFDRRHKDVIDQHEQDGTLAHGVEDFPAEGMTRQQEEVIHRDAVSGAETKHLVVKAQHRTEKLPWENLKQAGAFIGFVRNKRSDRVWAVYQSADKTDPTTGRVTPHYRLMGPTGMQFQPTQDVGQALHAEAGAPPEWFKYSKYLPLSEDQAKADWQSQYDSTPAFTEAEEHFVTGALLPVWGRLAAGAGQDSKPRIYRLKVGDRNLVGRHIAPEFLDEFRKNFGIHEESKQHNPAEVHGQIESGKVAARLANGWRVAPVKVQGERRLEIKGFNSSYEVDPLVASGVIKETIAHQRRYFVPVGEEGKRVLERIAATHPITQVEPIQLSQATGLSQSSISTSVREQVLLDLQEEVNRLFPLSDFGK